MNIATKYKNGVVRQRIVVKVKHEIFYLFCFTRVLFGENLNWTSLVVLATFSTFK